MTSSKTRGLIEDRFGELVRLVQDVAVDPLLAEFLVDAVDSCRNTLVARQSIILMGNGGSYADALHTAAEFTGRFVSDRRPLPAMVLGSNPSSMTAIANDYGYEFSFSRELEAFLNFESTVLAFSTSGNSPNVNKALRVCQERNSRAFALLGNDGGIAAHLCKSFVVPSATTALVQEVHMSIAHTLCILVEDALGVND